MNTLRYLLRPPAGFIPGSLFGLAVALVLVLLYAHPEAPREIARAVVQADRDFRSQAFAAPSLASLPLAALALGRVEADSLANDYTR